ncbi:hypothetical protein SAMN02745702_01996 [Desulfobaculum bizertense DSM 18034]|uniref:Uncharacterized protein n=1 Tax=Desulfobaculum bizertense DSM 18034 TaxID=1121442 RepID=A0A1T4WBK7_9BACT|nr:hypothetical protein SAMN02745702_01996 [Desulfobaculum bizertense DSM 18034]
MCQQPGSKTLRSGIGASKPCTRLSKPARYPGWFAGSCFAVLFLRSNEKNSLPQGASLAHSRNQEYWAKHFFLRSRCKRHKKTRTKMCCTVLACHKFSKSRGPVYLKRRLLLSFFRLIDQLCLASWNAIPKKRHLRPRHRQRQEYTFSTA